MSLFEILQSKSLIIWSEIVVAVIALLSAYSTIYVNGKIAEKLRSLLLLTSLWLTANIYFRTSPDHLSAVWAGNVNAIAFILTPYAFLDFIQHLLPPVTDRDGKILNSMPYPVMLNVVLILTTPLVFSHVEPSFWGWAMRSGILFPFYALTMIGYTAVASYKVYAVYPTLSAAEKNRLKFLLTAFAIAGISAFTNILLTYGVPFPQGILGFIFSTLLALYAVASRRVWDYPYFLGSLAARGCHFIGAFIVAFIFDLVFHHVAPIKDSHILEIGTVVSFGATWYLMARLIPVKTMGNVVLSQLDPEKAAIYKAVERIAACVSTSRQPERWLEEIGKALGSDAPVFIPFEERFPHPCPPMDSDHPLRKKLCEKQSPIFIEQHTAENPCPAYDFNPSENPTREFALPIYSGDKTLGAIVFGPEFSANFHSSNAVGKLMKLAGEMGDRLADESPARGTAKVISLIKGNREIIDEEPFDSLEDLKSSEFFHFYLPALDRSIEIEFVEGDKVTKVY